MVRREREKGASREGVTLAQRLTKKKEATKTTSRHKQILPISEAAHVTVLGFKNLLAGLPMNYLAPLVPTIRWLRKKRWGKAPPTTKERIRGGSCQEIA